MSWQDVPVLAKFEKSEGLFELSGKVFRPKLKLQKIAEMSSVWNSLENEQTFRKVRSKLSWDKWEPWCNVIVVKLNLVKKEKSESKVCISSEDQHSLPRDAGHRLVSARHSRNKKLFQGHNLVWTLQYSLHKMLKQKKKKKKCQRMIHASNEFFGNFFFRFKYLFVELCAITKAWLYPSSQCKT